MGGSGALVVGLGAAAVVLAALLLARRRRTSAEAELSPTPDDLFGELNGLLIRCQRLRAAGVADVERMREQIVALAVKERALQLEITTNVTACRAHVKVSAAVAAIAAAITKLEEACELPAECAPVSAEAAAEDTYREQLLMEEDTALDAYVERANAAGDSSLARRLEMLAHLIDRLRATEENLDFHAALLHCHAKLSSELGYSQANFSYGSTPYHSWRSLHNACPKLDAAMRSASSDGACVVFGSSLGWLCFYAALTYGIPTTGYELVGPLATLSAKVPRSKRALLCVSCSTARHARSRLRLQGLSMAHLEGLGAGHSLNRTCPVRTQVAAAYDLSLSCTFLAADMLTADLSAAKVVTLTSKCWDRPLCAKVRARLQRASRSHCGAMRTAV